MLNLTSPAPERVPFKRTLSVLAGFIFGLYVLNSIFLSLMNPTGETTKVNAGVNFLNPITVVFETTNLTGGSLPGNTVGGYVNFFTPNSTIYINKTLTTGGPENPVYPQVVAHEQAHLHQKQLIASVAGGYPNHYNPLQTIKYLITLNRLNLTLSDIAPPVKPSFAHKTIPVPNLETLADCAVITKAYNPNYAGYKGVELCSPTQIAVVLAMEDTKWPTPAVINQYLPEATRILDNTPDSKTVHQLNKN